MNMFILCRRCTCSPNYPAAVITRGPSNSGNWDKMSDEGEVAFPKLTISSIRLTITGTARISVPEALVIVKTKLSIEARKSLWSIISRTLFTASSNGLVTQ